MDPLIKIGDDELGVSKMKYDHITPGCSLCARKNTGVITPAYLALRGHWALVADLGVEAFVLDSRLDVVFLELPSGKRKALIVDLRFSHGAAVTAHEECAEKAANKLSALRDVEGEWGETEGVVEEEISPYTRKK